MTFTNVSIAEIMQRAYEVKGYQISGPDWMSSARFDISARVPAGAPCGQRMDGPGRGMMDGPRMGKDGMPQLPPGTPRGTPMMIGEGQMIAPGGKIRMISNGTTIGKFLDVLANQLDRPVTDMTGLSGTYDIT